MGRDGRDGCTGPAGRGRAAEPARGSEASLANPRAPGPGTPRDPACPGSCPWERWARSTAWRTASAGHVRDGRGIGPSPSVQGPGDGWDLGTREARAARSSAGRMAGTRDALSRGPGSCVGVRTYAWRGPGTAGPAHRAGGSGAAPGFWDLTTAPGGSTPGRRGSVACSSRGPSWERSPSPAINAGTRLQTGTGGTRAVEFAHQRPRAPPLAVASRCQLLAERTRPVAATSGLRQRLLVAESGWPSG